MQQVATCSPRALGKQVATCLLRALGKHRQELSGSIAESSWEAGSRLLPEIFRQAGGILSAKTDGLNWQTVSQDRRSQLADCQPRPTVSTGRLSAKT
ncbi:hypothetical protein PCASD_22904 [Puccinia coronata f. sp. avenae]|uniref:Uncharacterized protein n=1 Tax=Puccinia coronata f. sp. avenae TaxID=200324 RepID=A0A2N5U315_9BASI|nr:hypothetical protein PCASD_22904 [Puccinia coronata f. sp. avenae]